MTTLKATFPIPTSKHPLLRSMLPGLIACLILTPFAHPQEASQSSPVATANSSTSAVESAEPLTLPQLRQKLRQSILTTLLPERQKYRDALFSLEKQLASSGDYKGAIRARDERLQIEEEIAISQQQLLNPQPIPTATTKTDSPIKLSLDQATLHQLTLISKNPSLTDWVPNASSATFTLPNLPQGGYEVIINYNLKADSNATIQFKETRYSLTTSLPPTESKQPREHHCGLIRITNGSGPLTLQAIQLPLDQELKIHSITLKPGGL